MRTWCDRTVRDIIFGTRRTTRKLPNTNKTDNSGKKITIRILVFLTVLAYRVNVKHLDAVYQHIIIPSLCGNH